MAGIQVTTGKLQEEGQHLSNLKRDLNTELGQLKSIAARYLRMWEGEAHDAFVQSANKNIDLLLNYINTLEKFAKALTEGANAYETGEREAVRIASNKGQ